MAMHLIGRADDFVRRHEKLAAGLGFAWLMIVSAHYARFITLPDIIEIPVVASGILIGLRYAIWDGLIRPRLDRMRTVDGSDERAP